MKFMDYQYQRPDMEAFEADFNGLLQEFESADTPETQDRAFRAINQLRNEFKCMKSLSFIRHSLNLADEFYKQENEAMGVAAVKYQELVSKLYKALVESKFRAHLECTWGKHIFNLAEHSLGIFSPEIAKDLQRENELAEKYMEIIATSKASFQGKERGLAELMACIQDKDRAVRKGAQEALAAIFAQEQDKLDQLFDDLVQIRHKIALNLGYENFLGLGYARLRRTDYTPDMVSKFRDQIHQHVVPIIRNLRKRQAKRLGLTELKYYDENLDFLKGNAKYSGCNEEILRAAQNMYEEMSPETEEYFRFMLDHDLLDLLDRDGKFQVDYCEFVAKYKLPFICTNFNGTASDIANLTHEAGHGFQFYCSRDFELPEYYEPTPDIAEVHSMSMELFAWPWLKHFFHGDTDKFKFSAIDTAFKKISLVTIGDEFQEWVYTNPEASPQERTNKWREIEKKYWPHKDYDGNEFLDSGGYWYRLMHIFHEPFYLIDYALAQVCAFQFFAKIQESGQRAWSDYVHLCKAGGSASFTSLLYVADIKSPFIDGSVQNALKPIQEWLNQVDDSSF